MNTESIIITLLQEARERYNSNPKNDYNEGIIRGLDIAISEIDDYFNGEYRPFDV